MAASKQTLVKVIEVLINELGRSKAKYLVNRLAKETRGNESYNATIRQLNIMLQTPPTRAQKLKENPQCNGYCENPEACTGGCYQC